MASTLPQIKCALCHQAIDPLGPYFRASGEFLPAGDQLAGFCNAPMHWGCYAKWPQRPRFARAFVEAWVQANRKNPYWWQVHLDEEVYVSANPESPIEEAAVRLLAIGNDIRVPLPRWSEWLDDPDRVTPGLQPVEKQALTRVLPRLKSLYPDDHAVVHAVDPDEKRARAGGKKSASKKAKRS